MALTPRVDGESVLGSPRVRSTTAHDTLAGTASGIVLLDTAGVEYVLWVDSTGDLRVGTRANFTTPNSAGTVIGTQS